MSSAIFSEEDFIKLLQLVPVAERASVLNCLKDVSLYFSHSLTDKLNSRLRQGKLKEL